MLFLSSGVTVWRGGVLWTRQVCELDISMIPVSQAKTDVPWTPRIISILKPQTCHFMDLLARASGVALHTGTVHFLTQGSPADHLQDWTNTTGPSNLAHGGCHSDNLYISISGLHNYSVFYLECLKAKGQTKQVSLQLG